MDRDERHRDAGVAPYSYNVVVTINSGRIIRGGFYLFTIRDSSNGNSSVQDLAENHLDGVFYGSFPSGNGINRSDFVAELDGYHNKIFAPQTIVGTANNANGGVGVRRWGRSTAATSRRSCGGLAAIGRWTQRAARNPT